MPAFEAKARVFPRRRPDCEEYRREVDAPRHEHRLPDRCLQPVELLLWCGALVLTVPPGARPPVPAEAIDRLPRRLLRALGLAQTRLARCRSRRHQPAALGLASVTRRPKAL